MILEANDENKEQELKLHNYANLLIYLNLLWSSKLQLKFGQQSHSCHFSKYSLFLFILCRAGGGVAEALGKLCYHS